MWWGEAEGRGYITGVWGRGQVKSQVIPPKVWREFKPFRKGEGAHKVLK